VAAAELAAQEPEAAPQAPPPPLVDDGPELPDHPLLRAPEWTRSMLAPAQEEQLYQGSSVDIDGYSISVSIWDIQRVLGMNVDVPAYDPRKSKRPKSANNEPMMLVHCNPYAYIPRSCAGELRRVLAAMGYHFTKPDTDYVLVRTPKTFASAVFAAALEACGVEHIHVCSFAMKSPVWAAAPIIDRHIGLIHKLDVAFSDWQWARPAPTAEDPDAACGVHIMRWLDGVTHVDVGDSKFEVEVVTYDMWWVLTRLMARAPYGTLTSVDNPSAHAACALATARST
jgi:surface antigen